MSALATATTAGKKSQFPVTAAIFNYTTNVSGGVERGD